MRRWFSTAMLGTWTAAVAACGSTVLSDSCAGEDSTMFIAGCLQVRRDTCVAQPTTTAVFQLEGTLAPLVTTRYVCSAQVENQIGGDAGHASIQLLSATVRLLVPDTGEVFTLTNGQKAESTFPITGVVPPDDGADPGVAVVDLVLMDTATVDDLVPLTLANGPMTFQAQVLLQGRTLEGQDVTSQEFFLYPIEVLGGSECVVPPALRASGARARPPPTASQARTSSMGWTAAS